MKLATIRPSCSLIAQNMFHRCSHQAWPISLHLALKQKVL
jgi:hypothetical protein